MKYQFLILTFIFSILPFSIFSQHQVHKRALKFQELAFIHFRQGDTTNAREFALRAIKKDSLYATPWVLIGNIYEVQKKNIRAIETYTRALQLNPDEFPDLFYVLAELELEQQLFKNARKHVLKYLLLKRGSEDEKELAQHLLRLIGFREKAYANPVDFMPKNLGDKVNSANDDYVNSMSTDAQSMFITIKKNIGADIQGRFRFSENIYQIDFNDSTWSTPSLLDLDVELGYAIGGASVSPNNHYLFFTVCNHEKSQGGCDLFYAKINSGILVNPKNLGPIVNSNSWDSQPSFSSDGKSLFFASKRPGGFGGSDIWIAELDDNGRFQKPFNAGEIINSKGDEMAPLIHYDARTMYFASNGHMGMGGFDLFITRRDSGGDWQQPANFGYPINTEEDEINLIVAPSGKSAYISSNTEMGYGGFDIYKFDLNEALRPNTVSYLQGLVFDEETGKNLNAKVELNLLETGEQFTRTESSQNDGEFLVALPSNEIMGLNVSKTGYLFHSEHFDTRELGTSLNPIELKIPLQKIKLGNVTVLNNIFFETDSFRLNETSYPELEKLIQFIRKNPSLRLEISGHTDDVGSPTYNQQLSERRAASVVEFLVRNEIEKNRLVFKGYGMIKPIDSNLTVEGRAKNRRTEFKIISF